MKRPSSLCLDYTTAKNGKDLEIAYCILQIFANLYITSKLFPDLFIRRNRLVLQPFCNSGNIHHVVVCKVFGNGVIAP